MYTHLQFLWGQCKRLLVVMNGQMCEAHLVQRSAQVVHALLTLSTQLHVPPQEGKTLKTHTHVEEQSSACNCEAKRRCMIHKHCTCSTSVCRLATYF